MTHELFQRHPENPILSIKNWPYPANSVFNAAAVLVEDVPGLPLLETA